MSPWLVLLGAFKITIYFFTCSLNFKNIVISNNTKNAGRII